MANTANMAKLEAALRYAKYGWAIFPVYEIADGKCSCGKPDCQNPGKHPRTPNGVKDASKDPDQIRKWWTQYPEANIGLAAGKTSNIAILDVDGDSAIQYLKDRKYDETPTLKTGSGKGAQLIFKPWLDETPNLVRFKKFEGKDGLDLRGDHGYGILPPSNHISGGFYEWLIPPDQTETRPPPQWVKNLVEPIKQAAGIVDEVIQEGQRNEVLFSLAGSMRTRGLNESEIFEALKIVNENRCLPPLSDKEVRLIAKSISRYEPQRERGKIIRTVKNNVAPIQLDHITQIENPSYLKQKITVGAVVSSTFRSYAIPSEVKAIYYDSDGMRHDLTKTINLDDAVNLKFPNATSNFKQKTLAGLFPEIPKNAQVMITDTAYRTIYTGRIRPPVFTLEKQGDQIVDEQGFEYKDFQVSIISNTQLVFPASSLMTLTGYVLPDPNTQRTTILVTDVEFPEAIQNYNESKLLYLLQFFQDKTIDERLEWVFSNFELYSKIVGRRNVTTATFLGFYTPTWIQLDGERQRGWANILILGDTTTGKTETVRKAIRLFQAGTIITAETASTVGLVGAATQYDRSGWAVDWGFLVLNNGKLLAIDGAQKLDKYQWAALAESERSGVVTISKAAKDTAYAQTKQIKIANPTDPDSKRRETKTLNEYFYPVQGVGSFLDIQNVARLDLAVLVDANDVDAAAINKRFNEEPDPRLELMGEVLKWVWSNKAEIRFTTEAVDYLLEESTKLYDKFNDKKIPLCSIDLKWKIARLSAAIAAITLSTDEQFNTLHIEKTHVNHITKFIETEYKAAGLDLLVKHSGETQITMETVEEILYDLGEAIGATNDPDIETAYKILEFIAYQGVCVKDQIKDKFSLSDKNQLRPLLARLNSHDLIKQGRGYAATAKLNRLVRYIEANPSDFAMFATFATLKEETPPKTGMERFS